MPALAACVILDGKTVEIGAVGVRKYGIDVAVTREQFAAIVGRTAWQGNRESDAALTGAGCG